MTRIHSQLLADCHLLGRFTTSTLLLNRNASLPWFILVPATEVTDILDLPSDMLATVTEECAVVSRFLKRGLGYRKVNFAGLGNVVPQMHLHIIGRSESDPCWPQPVWGNLAVSAEYAAETLAEWQRMLVEEYGLCAME
jgi:diadenosine tetraphosphate (Ap4A) HIT family hydrolase